MSVLYIVIMHFSCSLRVMSLRLKFQQILCLVGSFSFRNNVLSSFLGDWEVSKLSNISFLNTQILLMMALRS